jgi:hypothetical protein
MFVSWFVFPLVMAVLAIGCGALLETACRVRLPGTMLAPAGLCVMIVVGAFMTQTDGTAELATPIVVGLAVAGLVLLLLRRPWRPDWWSVGAAVAVFAVFAAPLVLFGELSIAGYLRLSDTATWPGYTDLIMDSGRNVDALLPSEYENNMRRFLDAGYPIGSTVPLGIGHILLDRDTAWLLQPSLALFAPMMALVIYALVLPFVRSRPGSAAIAFVGSQPALLFGYYLLGGIKEMAAAFALLVFVTLLLPVLRPAARWEHMIPVAVACAAVFAILSLAGAIWLVAPLAAAGVILYAAGGWELVLPRAGILAGATFLLSLPLVVQATDFLSTTGRDTLADESDLGVFDSPLNALQMLGIWPSLDVDFDPSSMGLTYLLLAILALAVVAALVFAWRRRAWGPLLWFSAVALGTLVTVIYASPWVDAKAYAITSPALVTLGLLGVVAVARADVGALAAHPRARAALAAVMGVAIVGGVAWSTVQAYRGANLSPYDRLHELELIGHRYAGQGPTMTIEWERYAVRHFLRGMEPESSGEAPVPRFPPRRPVYLRSGQTVRPFSVVATLPSGEKRVLARPTDVVLDNFRVQSILQFRTLVLRRSPVASRPPAAYRLVSKGRYYEVWQRPQHVARPTLEHYPLGDPLHPTATASCRAVERLAERAGSGGMLATVLRLPAILTTKPVTPRGDGSVESTFTVPTAGRYGLWVGGAGFREQIEIAIDGRPVAKANHRLNPTDQFQPMTDVELAKGRHRLVLSYENDPHPLARPIGPVVLSKGTADSPVTLVSPRDAVSLCGQRLDWIEALGRRQRSRPST